MLKLAEPISREIDEELRALAALFRSARKRKHLTVLQAATRMGVSDSSVRKLENLCSDTKRLPSEELCVRACQCYGVDATAIASRLTKVRTMRGEPAHGKRVAVGWRKGDRVRTRAPKAEPRSELEVLNERIADLEERLDAALATRRRWWRLWG